MYKIKASQNITLIAILSAFNVIFALLIAFLPTISLVLYLFLPFITTIMVLKCQKQFHIIYYFSSIIVTFLINLNGLEYIIFTLLPSLITGTIFGWCIKKKVNIGIIILISTFCQFVFSLLTIPIINLIYGVESQSILDIFKAFLGSNKEYLLYKIFLPITFVTSLAQNIISFLIVSSSIAKLNYEVNSSHKPNIAYSYLNLSFIILTILAIWLFDDLMFLFLSMSILLSAIIVATTYEKSKKYYIFVLISSLLSILAGTIILSKSHTIYVPLLLLIPALLITIKQFIFQYVNQRAKMVK